MKFLTDKRTHFAIQRHVGERKEYVVEREITRNGAKSRRTAKLESPLASNCSYRQNGEDEREKKNALYSVSKSLYGKSISLTNKNNF